MPSWLSDLVGADLAPLASWVLAAAIVVVLLVVVISIAKKLLGGSMSPRSRGKGPRLAVLDVAPIDQKRKLVLVRRDEMEHLILIGGQNDVVVESGIARAPLGGRQRNEPSLRGEPAMPDVADRVPPRQAARPTPQRAVPQNGVPRDGEGPRAASPLARPVPRPPVQAIPPQAQQRRPAPEPIPFDAPAIDPVSAPSLGTAEIVAPAASRVPPISIDDLADERYEAKTAPEPDVDEKPFPVVEPVTRQAQPVPPLAPVAAPVAAVASPPAERRDPRPAAPAPTEPAPVIATAPPAERAPERAFVMPPRLPASLPVATPEPVLRRATPVAPPPVQPRSMATPTIPVKPAPESLESNPSASHETIEEKTAPPTWANASTLMQNVAPPSSPPAAGLSSTATSPQPPFRGPLPPFTVQMTPKPFDPQPVKPAPTEVSEPESASPLGRETDGAAQGSNVPSSAAPANVPPARPTAPSAPPISLSNLSGARATPTVAPPVSGPSVPVNLPAVEDKEPELEDERSATVQPEAPVLSKPVFPVLGNTPELSEKRPLSVRSFATTIQSRKNGDAPQQRVEPIAPPVPVSAPPVTPTPAARVNLPPIPMPAPPVLSTPSPQAPKPASKPEMDDGDSLEDFLSAELDSDFGKQNWQDEDDAARSTEKTSTPATATAEKTPPRALTLEEEMERLLGDFDFEVSDRKKL